METIKKFWWIVLALVLGFFAFKKRKTIKRKIKKNKPRNLRRRLFAKNNYASIRNRTVLAYYRNKNGLRTLSKIYKSKLKRRFRK